MLAALLSPEPALVELAARGLSHLDTADSLQAMLVLLAAPSQPEVVRNLARSAVQRRLGRIPDQDFVRDQLSAAAHRAWRESQEWEQRPGPGRPAVIWRWDAAQSAIAVQSTWSEVPAVQVMAVRLLRRMARNEVHWAEELLEHAYLEPDLEEWADLAE